MRSLKQLIKGLCPVSPAEEKRFVPRVLDIYRRSVQYPIFLINFPQVSWGSSGIDSSSVNEVMNTYCSNRFKPHGIIRWHYLGRPKASPHYDP